MMLLSKISVAGLIIPASIEHDGSAEVFLCFAGRRSFSADKRSAVSQLSSMSSGEIDVATSARNLS
jgi:hypothetical protein